MSFICAFRPPRRRGARLFFLLAALFCLGKKAQAAAPGDGMTLLEAVETTLRQDPAIQIQKEEVRRAEGQARYFSGAFDPALNASASYLSDRRAVAVSPAPTAFSRFNLDEISVRGSVDALLRSGILVSPGVEATRSDDNGSRVVPESRAEVNLLIRVPLLKGLGKNNYAAASERSAKLQVEAARLGFRHTLAQRALNSTLLYWGLAEAEARWQIVRASEQRAENLIEQVRALVQADETPPAELRKLEANLASVRGSRLSAEQGLAQARQQLGFSIGLAAADAPAAKAVPEALDQFAEPSPLEGTPADWQTAALGNRQDLAALAKTEEAERALLAGARNALKPQLDLTFKAGYGGVETGSHVGDYFSSFSENVQGASGFVALQFGFPLGNNQAKGLHQQQEAAAAQRELQRMDLGRSILTEVDLGITRLQQISEELVSLRQAKTQYETAVTDEKQKLNLGMATILDVLQLEDRLTGSSLAYLSALSRYGMAVARFRFQTGTLITQADSDTASVSMETLTRLPRASGSRN